MADEFKNLFVIFSGIGHWKKVAMKKDSITQDEFDLAVSDISENTQ